jgi:hypothetical protein
MRKMDKKGAPGWITNLEEDGASDVDLLRDPECARWNVDRAIANSFDGGKEGICVVCDAIAHRPKVGEVDDGDVVAYRHALATLQNIPMMIKKNLQEFLTLQK